MGMTDGTAAICLLTQPFLCKSPYHGYLKLLMMELFHHSVLKYSKVTIEDTNLGISVIKQFDACSLMNIFLFFHEKHE